MGVAEEVVVSIESMMDVFRRSSSAARGGKCLEHFVGIYQGTVAKMIALPRVVG